MKDGLLNQERENKWLDLIDRAVNAVTVLLIIGFFLTILCYLFFRPYQIKGNSMADTILDGTTAVISTSGGSANRGDIVVIDTSVDDMLSIAGDDKFIIKRVVAVGGDKIGFVYNSTKTAYSVYLNTGSGWQKLNEDYAGEMTRVNDLFTSITVCNDESELDLYGISVQNGKVFVMGDNRDVSADSRKFGQFSLGSIKGKYLCSLVKGGIIEGFLSLIYNSNNSN